MRRELEFVIHERHSNMTTLQYLRDFGFSRHLLTAMKSDPAAIRLNGIPAGGNAILQPRDRLTVRIPEEQHSGKLLPVPVELNILYEDEDLLVVNKAADMPVHPSAGNYENTLANGAAYYFSQKGEAFTCRCVNRLDRDTTGALILAKNQLSSAILSAQMRNREIRRTYLAVVEGLLPEKGTVSAPIARRDGSTIERCVDLEHGEPAVTRYERLAYQNGCSLAELHLETGRTHQIRVHMKYIEHPLPGDFLYHPVYDRIRRQPLHSYQLEFLHPVSKEPMLFTAPVPEDMVNAFTCSSNRSHKVPSAADPRQE